jgi:hypothetical protein
MNVTHPTSFKERRKFVPEAAKISPAAAVVAMVVSVFVTLSLWLAFKSLNPVVPLALGASAGGILLVTINWMRRKSCPPSLVLGPAGIIIEDRQERVIIPWTELAGIRHVTEDGESLEISSCFGGEPFVLSVSTFSPEQAAEIKRALLPKAA